MPILGDWLPKLPLPRGHLKN
ncbi:hypothetical protein XACJK4_2830003 [Xanthomonas citri pv. citri]|nr:hypothetical protein XACJK4_2830003 [Xanthomonas citri pv. citri]